jgi:hypothetical protein
MGLAASDLEVDQVLQKVGLGEPTSVAQLARRLSISSDAVRDAVRHWLMVQQARELIAGVGHLDLDTRLAINSQAAMFGRDPRLQPYIDRMLVFSRGMPRVSEPLIGHFLQDQGAKAKVTAVAVDAEHVLDRVPPPDEGTLKTLFEQHRDELRRPAGAPPRPQAPGTSAPASSPLGYRFPDRVKIEVMTLPADRVEKKVDAAEDEALAYYEAHREQFRNSAPTATQPQTQPQTQPAYKDYAQARDQVIRQLKGQKAAELSERMVKAAQAVLNQGMPDKRDASGYRELGDWQPPSMEEAARQVQAQFGVLPDVRRIEDRWLTEDDLAGLGGIGQSMAAAGGREPVPFTSYALSTRELSPQAESPLALLRLQRGVASQPLTDPLGGASRYLFRIIDAQPSHAPESLDEVRPEVEQDARRLAAYALLVKDKDKWMARLQQEGPDALAAGEHLRLLNPPPFPRRERGQFGMEVPNVPGVGQSEPFVEGVFEMVERIGSAGAVDSAPIEQRTAAIPVEAQAKLFLVRLDGFEPLTRSEFEERMRMPGLAMAVQESMTDIDPFSMEAISRRTGFVRKGGDKEEDKAG